MAGKFNRKSERKQKRAYHKLLRDMNIKCCEKPTQNVMVCNAGLVTGFQRETLENLVATVVDKYELIMLPNKSYCFVKCYTAEDGTAVYNKLHNNGNVEGLEARLYATFTESVPDSLSQKWPAELPNGLKITEDIINEDQERMLLSTVNWDNESSSDLRHRKVKHFGYEFQYGLNTVDLHKPIDPIPKEYQFLQSLVKKYDDVSYEYDQLTINCYSPGQGIPPHVDTHSAFEDTILSLSLGSACVMHFRRKNKKVDVLLPPRSLLIISGEARYAWSHAISHRHSDVVQTSKGITVYPRGTRVSFTFRKLRRGNCSCDFSEYCDSKVPETTSFIDGKVARGIENSYVHNVYENISNHFDETRHKQWPNVAKFLQTLQIGDILLDVGCGNGKYLYQEKHVFKIGCDRSSNLIRICWKKGFEVLLSDCLHLPFRDNSLDAVICIAVIHHLSTEERRRSAVNELTRILRPSGRCLIYVWAKEQEKDSVQTVYLRPNTKKEEKEVESCVEKLTDFGVTLPVHKNRTRFTSNDMFVPWKRKGGGNFFRYYHVFEENELSQLCSDLTNVKIEKVYYDQGNRCIILQKE